MAMRVSTTTDYGLRAMMDLARRYGQGTVPSADIAARQGIPGAYLDQVLSTLRKAGFVRGVRGPQGGHALTRPPGQITLGEVLAALEGATAPMECVGEPSSCHQAASCTLREAWQRVDEAVQGVLSSITIEGLVQRQLVRREMYYI